MFIAEEPPAGMASLLVTNKLLSLVAMVDQSQGIRGKGNLACQDDVVYFPFAGC